MVFGIQLMVWNGVLNDEAEEVITNTEILHALVFLQTSLFLFPFVWESEKREREMELISFMKGY